MPSRKYRDEMFKLQVYIPKKLANTIDKVCESRNLYRSDFVREAVESHMKKSLNKKHLEES